MYSLRAACLGSACGLLVVGVCLLTIGSPWAAALIVAATSWGVTFLYRFGDDPPSPRRAWTALRYVAAFISAPRAPERRPLRPDGAGASGKPLAAALAQD